MKKRNIITTSILSAFAIACLSGAIVTKSKVDSGVYTPTFATYTNHDAATYYNGISDSLSGNDLLKALRTLNLNKRQSTVGYGSMGTDPSGQYKYTDYDPNSVQYDSNNQPYGTRISSFYTYTSATSWNREHVWPNSHGGGSKGDAGSPYPDADIHMPRPTITSENSSRGNSFFVEGMNHSSNGWDPYTAGYSKDSRGEAARITFYCMLVNSKLNLAPANLTPSGTDPVTNISFGSGHTMGNLETLIKWNINHPVTQREKNRNEGAEYLQGNRNAFIDHPEYACRIWGNVNSTIKTMCQNADYETPESHDVTFRLYDDGVQNSLSSKTIKVGESFSIINYVDNEYNADIEWSLVNQDDSAYTGSAISLTSDVSLGNYVGATITANSAGSAYLKATYNFISSSGKALSNSTTLKVTAIEEGGDIPPEDADYTLVTKNSDLSDGDKVVVTLDRKLEEVIGVTGWNNNKDAEVSIKENEWLQYTVQDASSNGFKLFDSSAEQYIASPTANEFKYSTSAGSCSVSNDGMLMCNNRYLCKNGTNYRFYTSTSNYVPFYVYKLSSGQSEKTLTSISITNEKTTYTVGDSFVKPTVIAHFSDSLTSNVTNEATFTGYDLSKAGNYNVGVSYTYNDVTKSTSYQITVQEKIIPQDVSLISIHASNPKTEYLVDEEFEKPTVIGTYSDSSTKDVTNVAQFTVPDLSTAGTKTVSIKVFDEVSKLNIETSYQITVTENQGPVIPVDSISLNVTNNRLELLTGESYQFIVTFFPDNATTKKLRWEIDFFDGEFEGCASLSDDGLLTTNKAGYVQITVFAEKSSAVDYCLVKISDKKTSPSKKTNKGCFGSVVATSVILSTLSVLGIALLLVKKHTEKE